MLYIRKLELANENDETVFKIKGVKAREGLSKALEFMKDKEGDGEVRGVFKEFLSKLDKEFKDYFDMG